MSYDLLNAESVESCCENSYKHERIRSLKLKIYYARFPVTSP